MNWQSNICKILPLLLFQFSLVLAPIAYGSTRPWTESLLAGVLMVVFTFWLISRWSKACPPHCILQLLIFFLLAQGWWMTGNAHQLWDADYGCFIPLKNWLEWAPGSVDKIESKFAMWRLTGLLGALMVAVSLASNPHYRLRMVWTMALTGVAVAVIGIILKIDGWRMMRWFWEPGKISHNNFALYRYHGNAGAFLNLTLPFLLGLASNEETGKRARFWLIPGVVIVLVALQINASKAAMLVGWLICMIFVWRRSSQAGESMLNLWRRHGGMIMGVVLAIIISSLVVSYCSSYQTSWGRWMVLRGEAQTSYLNRLEVYQITFGMLGEAGCWGFGPETFSVIFPRYLGASGLKETFYFTHNDYLQTALEWGWAGFAAWALLFATGLYAVLKRCLVSAKKTFLEEAPLWALAGVLIHAGFDFPLQIDSLRLYAFTALALCWSASKGPVCTK